MGEGIAVFVYRPKKRRPELAQIEAAAAKIANGDQRTGVRHSKNGMRAFSGDAKSAMRTAMPRFPFQSVAG